MPNYRGVVTPDECQVAQEEQQEPLPDEARPIVDFLNTQLKKYSRGSASVSGDGVADAVEATAQVFRAAGWQVHTGYCEGLCGRTVESAVTLGYTIEVWW
jgi:hypothetical protein